MPSVTISFRALTRKRDFYAGGLMVLIGCGVALKGLTYRSGTLMHMGPGFLPTALGAILALLGVAIALAGSAGMEAGEHEERILPANPEWFGWLCILAGPLFFIVLGRYFGMIPAIFGCVFVSALGDRSATLLSSFVLALVITVLGVALFSYFLQIPLPLLMWKGSL